MTFSEADIFGRKLASTGEMSMRADLLAGISAGMYRKKFTGPQEPVIKLLGILRFRRCPDCSFKPTMIGIFNP